MGDKLGYMQPDFRPIGVTDADPAGPKPIPMDILLRRIGFERKTTVGSQKVVAEIELIYAMYAVAFREKDMAPCYKWLEEFKKRTDTSYKLYPPTLVP